MDIPVFLVIAIGLLIGAQLPALPKRQRVGTNAYTGRFTRFRHFGRK